MRSTALFVTGRKARETAGKALKPPAADFTSPESKKKPEADLRQVLENGKPGTGMGPWKSQLRQSELNDLMGYVMTLRE